MRGSLKLGRIAGIGIYLHWTFLILVVGIFIAFAMTGAGWQSGLLGVVFIGALFFCIVLHELGHALTARRFGVETRDITLLPIGGLARLQRMPDRPLQEFWVAVAGPIVTALIAAVLAVAVWLVGGWEAMQFEATELGALAAGNFFANLMWINLFILVFNLIPAFPMDGGRMLRSLLALKLDYVRATNIAAALGQILAIGFAILAVIPPFFNPILLFIALFVFFGAAAESRLASVRALLEDVPVTEAMITQYRSLSPDDPVQTAVDELLAGWQTDFPVVEEGRFLGVVHRSDIIGALQEGRANVPVRELIQHECAVVSDRDMLYRVMERMQSDRCSAIPVLHDDELVGVVTNENIGELLMVRSALAGRRTDRESELVEAR